MKLARLSVSLLGLLVVAAGAHAQTNQKEIIKGTYTIRGKFLRFEVGDYVHAVIKDAKGKERSFYLGGVGLDFYLAINAAKSGSFTYQKVNAHIEEAGGRIDLERMESAKIGKQGSDSWWKSQLKKMSVDDINKKYQPLVDKLTKNG